MDIQIKSSRAVLATDSAVKKLVELKTEEGADNSFLRMGVKPGGCSGFSYEMFFDTDKFDGDVIEEYDGVNIVVDSQSLEHVKGATLDYKEGLMESGFSIDNPNVSRTCGCGNSFS
jgi:iron-sulfur cluster assembly accessory protein